MKKRKKKTAPKGLTMVPCTDDVMAQMMASVLETMVERGLVEVKPGDEEGVADRVMAIVRDQGLTNAQGDVIMGRCILLPPSGRPGLHLLLVTPWPADGYDETLKRKPSPVRFERTPQGRITLPGRTMLAKLEELADNPAASEAGRAAALKLTRVALPVPPLVLPSQAQTVALAVTDRDGSRRIIEALPAGIVISLAEAEA